MIWEKQPVAELIEKLNSIGVRSIVFDPYANKFGKNDFLEVMNKNIQNLENILR